VVVISDGSYQVAGTVDDTEVGQLKTGEQVVITPDGSTTPVYGTVGTVGLVPSSTSGVAAYPVTVNVTGNPGGLYPGRRGITVHRRSAADRGAGRAHRRRAQLGNRQLRRVDGRWKAGQATGHDRAGIERLHADHQWAN